jgi:hypothetical protein
VLSVAAALNDDLMVIAFAVFNVANAVAKTGDTMTGSLLLPAGTVSAPALTTSADTNTGIFFPAADTIAFSEGGVESMRIDSSGNVGIGTSSPNAKLDVASNGVIAQFTGNGARYQGIGIRNNFASGSNVGSTFYDAVNENGATVANMGADIYTDGSSGWYWGTQPAGTRTDRRILRMNIDGNGNVLVTSAAGLGYGTGAGGTVTQATNKSTAVTLNKPTGQITMNNAALAAGAAASFSVLNSVVAASDVVVLTGTSSPDSNNYRIEPINIVAGGFGIRLTNITGGSRSEAVVINFTVIKGATS